MISENLDNGTSYTINNKESLISRIFVNIYQLLPTFIFKYYIMNCFYFFKKEDETYTKESNNMFKKILLKITFYPKILITILLVIAMHYILYAFDLLLMFMILFTLIHKSHKISQRYKLLSNSNFKELKENSEFQKEGLKQTKGWYII